MFYINKHSPDSDLDFSEGNVIIFDKPEGITSFDVIRKIRHIVKIKKIGHAGTLDPLASGLLIMCTGKMTKKIDVFQAQEKLYSGQIFLGASTASYDRETEVEEKFDISDIDDKQILELTKHFTGEIGQKPPIYSALKIDGERSYKKAYRGEKPEMKERIVFIHEFSITGIALPYISFIVKCSKGTYIRSLAHDFGKALNKGAYLHSLRRLKIGDYHVEDALNFELFNNYLKRCVIKAL